jgi:hypothetical protein
VAPCQLRLPLPIGSLNRANFARVVLTGKGDRPRQRRLRLPLSRGGPRRPRGAANCVCSMSSLTSGETKKREASNASWNVGLKTARYLVRGYPRQRVELTNATIPQFAYFCKLARHPGFGKITAAKPVGPGNVYPVVGIYYPDEISGDDAIYKTRLVDLLDRITQQAVGRLVLSLLPISYPVLITKMTAADIRRLGDCNAETGAFAETISLYGTAYRGHVRIIFTPNFTPDCSTTGPAARPHETLFHELVHAYDMAPTRRHFVLRFPYVEAAGRATTSAVF